MMPRLVHMRAGDLSDLYLLLKCYKNTYWKDNECHRAVLDNLIEEVEQMYQEDFPNAVPIMYMRNVRDAGRPKKYTEEDDQQILNLHKQGYNYNEITEKMGCSKSYVSKLIRKYPSNKRGEQ